MGRRAPRSLRIEADVRELGHVRQFVRDEAGGAGASDDCVDDLVQAVDEAATNVIVHGYAGAPGWLELGVDCDDRRCRVTLEDAAPTFDPTTVPEPDLSVPPDRRRPGGMGVHLIRLAVDAMTHRPRPGGGNILTLTRTLDPRPEEDR
jgi:serine/threonine-protein kinase RsbW